MLLTIENLKSFGANTQEGLSRCLNNETMYLRLVNMALEDANFGRLADAVEADDLRAAFEAAHAIKGIMGNLALTPLYHVVSEMTELLRARKDADYSAYRGKILRQREILLAQRAR